jgi:hypothetical protein
MNIQQVTQDIEHWIATFVEQPHPALGGWPPCPYARAARLKKSYQVLLGNDPLFDLQQRSRWGMYQWEVVIYVYNPTEWSADVLENNVAAANQQWLNRKDMIALSDHPAAPEIVQGVSMNQGTYALILVQSLSDLDQRARLIAQRGFYHGWPEDYLEGLFENRQDPRL